MKGNRTRFALVAAIAAACLAAPAGAGAQGPEGPTPEGANDFSCKPSKAHPRPVVLVHGLSARMGENWFYVSPRLADAGYCVFALTYGQDPRNAALPYSPGGLVAMQKSSRELKAFVNRVRAATGVRKVDLVGHSEGTVMPRWYLEKLGGRKRVKRFVALTPLWRGTQLAALDFFRDSAAGFGLAQPLIDLFSQFCASCPQFLRGSDYMNKLNADGERIRGIRHTNIVTRYDELVQPYTSGIMSDGGHNIVLQEVCPTDTSEHGAVAADPNVMQMILNALDPRHKKPIPC